MHRVKTIISLLKFFAIVFHYVKRNKAVGLSQVYIFTYINYKLGSTCYRLYILIYLSHVRQYAALVKSRLLDNFTKY